MIRNKSNDLNISNKRILVTGGAGFIGSHLVDVLIDRGAKVLVIDNLSTGRRENLNKKAKFYLTNMEDKKIDAIFKKEKPEIIYHLAFNTNVPKSVVDPLFDAKSLIGSLNIFNAAIKNGVKKIIMASSSFVYGNYHPSKFPISENYLPQLISPYAVSKISSENYLRFFHETYGLPIVIFRYGTVYGPRQIKGAMADYIKKIANGQRTEMYGDGNLTRDYVYVDDIVKANLLALNCSGDDRELIFNLGSGTETTLNQVYQKISKILDRKNLEPIYLAGRPGEIKRYCLSSKKAKEKLSWMPTIKLDQGLKKTISYFLRENKA